MYCPKCGAEIQDGAKFCGSCGEPVRSSQPNGATGDPAPQSGVDGGQPMGPEPGGKGLGGLITAIVIAAVVAVIGLIFFLDPFGFFHPGQTTTEATLESSYAGTGDEAAEVDGDGSGTEAQDSVPYIAPDEVKVELTGVTYDHERPSSDIVASGTVTNESPLPIASLELAFDVTYEYTNSYNETKENSVGAYVKHYDSDLFNTFRSLMNIAPGASQDFTVNLSINGSGTVTAIKSVTYSGATPQTNEQYAKTNYGGSDLGGFVPNDQYEASISFGPSTYQNEADYTASLTNKSDEYWDSPQVIYSVDIGEGGPALLAVSFDPLAPGATGTQEGSKGVRDVGIPKGATVIGVLRRIGQSD